MLISFCHICCDLLTQMFSNVLKYFFRGSFSFFDQVSKFMDFHFRHLQKVVCSYSGISNTVHPNFLFFKLMKSHRFCFPTGCLMTLSSYQSKQQLISQDYPLSLLSARLKQKTIIHLSSKRYDTFSFCLLATVFALSFWLNHCLRQRPPFSPSANLLQSDEKCAQYPRDRAIMTGKQ